VDTLTCMQAFIKAVETGSLAEAGRRLDVSAPMMTRYLNYLEKRVGARLINRSTTALSLTEAGSAYYERCAAAVAAVAEAEESAGAHASVPQGTLRISVSADFGASYLAPLMVEFLRQHSMIGIDVSFTNRMVDLVEEGLDLAIRISATIDPNLIARRLATTSLVACAAPDYLQRHGTPRTPEELAQHNCLVFGDSAYFRDWPFEQDGRRTVVHPRGNLRCGDTNVLRLAAVQGLGVLMLGSFALAEELSSGRLVPILTDYTIGQFGVFVVYANRRFLPPKVRLFVDSLVSRFGPDPQRDPFLDATRLDAIRPNA
jgi:DNA-binding transcriptional LysR family regulator